MGLWAAIKYAINSSVGTSEFKPLDKLMKDDFVGGYIAFKEAGTYTFTPPKGISEFYITACAGGGGAGADNETHPKNFQTPLGGGGGGGACIKNRKMIITKPILIVVGKGGKKGVIEERYQRPQAGKKGSATVIGDYLTLEGGEGGQVPQVYHDKYHNKYGSGGRGGVPNGGNGGNGFIYAKQPDENEDLQIEVTGASKGENGLLGKGDMFGGGGSIGSNFTGIVTKYDICQGTENLRYGAGGDTYWKRGGITTRGDGCDGLVFIAWGENNKTLGDNVLDILQE